VGATPRGGAGVGNALILAASDTKVSAVTISPWLIGFGLGQQF
jgi:hypothetical protein